MRFNLEQPQSRAAANQLIDGALIHIERVEVDCDSIAALDELNRRVNQRQRLEPQEVELNQVDVFEIFHRILRNNLVLAAGLV